MKSYCLKLMSAIFFQIFIFSPNDSPLKNYEKCYEAPYEKCLKSSLCSQDIQIFVIFSLPLHTFQIQKDKWKWNILCHELTCINLQM